jgi:hypothetical protein
MYTTIHYGRREEVRGYAASEGGAPFVARRAVNLHGCAPTRFSCCGGTPGSAIRPGVGRFTSLCPPFFLLRGYPSSAKLVLGRPPSSGDSAGPSCATPATDGSAVGHTLPLIPQQTKSVPP